MSWRRDLALIVACAAMLAFGAWLRAQSLGFPASMTWDEHHFVENARAYVQGKPDLNDHPPFGKLVIALAMRGLGDQSYAWRVAPLCAGLVTVLLVGWLAGWAAERRNAFWIGAAFAALDGFLISYSRCALLDGMLTCLCIASVVTAVRARGAPGAALAAVLLGSACCVKFSGIVFIVPVAWAIWSRTTRASALAWLVLAPVSYTAWYALGLGISGHAAGPAAVYAETKRLYLHHAGLTQWKHPMLSHWYQWFLPSRPIPLRFDPLPDGRVRVLNSLGNPALWWLVDVAVVVTLVIAVLTIVAAIRTTGARRPLRGLLETPTGRRVFLLLCWAMPIVPWMISRRDSYMNHYLPAYVFGIAVSAVLVDALYYARSTLGLLVVLAIGQVGLYYAPVAGQLPISPAGVDQRLFLRRWR